MTPRGQSRFRDTIGTWVELQQFLADFCHEMDCGGLNISQFYFSDGLFRTGKMKFEGHEEIEGFYSDRAARVRTQQEGGVRTVRHLFANLRISVEDVDHASLHFKMITYSGGGAPPLQDVAGPSAISDSQMDCERDADGLWRLKRFTGDVVFLGNDRFIQDMAFAL